MQLIYKDTPTAYLNFADLFIWCEMFKIFMQHTRTDVNIIQNYHWPSRFKMLRPMNSYVICSEAGTLKIKQLCAMHTNLEIPIVTDWCFTLYQRYFSHVASLNKYQNC